MWEMARRPCFGRTDGSKVLGFKSWLQEYMRGSLGAFGKLGQSTMLYRVDLGRSRSVQTWMRRHCRKSFFFGTGRRQPCLQRMLEIGFDGPGRRMTTTPRDRRMPPCFGALRWRLMRTRPGNLRPLYFTWLASRNRCWTSDRLARRDLPHQPTCPFCDQDVETINHILVSCAFARSVWQMALEALHKPQWMPAPDAELIPWCNSCTATDIKAKDRRTILSLGLWELWKHRNDIVFHGATPSATIVIANMEKEGRAWSAAGLFKGDFAAFFGGLAGWVRGRN